MNQSQKTLRPARARYWLAMATAMALGLVLSPWVVSASPSANHFQSIATPDLVVQGCVIRIPKNSGRPYIHTNPTHTCVGVKSVAYTSNGFLQIRSEDGGPIVAVNVTGDETVTGTRGIIVGASGGGMSTSVYFYDTVKNRRLHMRKRADRARVASDYSNIWITWVKAGKSNPTAQRTPSKEPTATDRPAPSSQPDPTSEPTPSEQPEPSGQSDPIEPDLTPVT